MKQELFDRASFRQAMECPTKLFYKAHTEYPVQSEDDPRIPGLYDMKEFAPHFFPFSFDVDKTYRDHAVEATAILLEQSEMTIINARIDSAPFSCTCDAVNKKGNTVEIVLFAPRLIENFDPRIVINKNRVDESKWGQFIYDLAFQRLVIQRAHPNLQIRCSLLLMSAKSLIMEGLAEIAELQPTKQENFKLLINQLGYPVSSFQRILHKVPVDEPVGLILGKNSKESKAFEAHLLVLAEAYLNRVKIRHTPGVSCQQCEYRCTDKQETQGLRSGFKECWQACLSAAETERLSDI